MRRAGFFVLFCAKFVVVLWTFLRKESCDFLCFLRNFRFCIRFCAKFVVNKAVNVLGIFAVDLPSLRLRNVFKQTHGNGGHIVFGFSAVSAERAFQKRIGKLLWIADGQTAQHLV